jgi:dTDP-glucose 4,6-dehydratase
MTKVLVTGGAGFIGHHMVSAILAKTDWRVTLLDRLDCSGNLNRLAEIGAAKNSRVRFVFHDLRAPINDQLAAQIGTHDYIIHLAAATHVDRSIDDPMSFVLDNVVGTCNLLDFARKAGCQKFVQFSTDEVFGPAPPGHSYKEDDRYRSGNPYAATKAGAEELAVSYHNTYRVPVMVTHTMNVIGERQHPEKFVPMTIAKVRDGQIVKIHSDKTRTKPGSRFYIHAKEVADAVLYLILHGTVGEKYNVVGAQEVSNLDMARMIATALKRTLNYEMVDFHSSRPGHDLRYALDGSKLAELGWRPTLAIDDAVQQIVKWTIANDHWLLDGLRVAA